MEEWIFGIDGGGTRTRLRIESVGGALLHEGLAGGTNPNGGGMSSAQAELARLFEDAYARTGLEPAGCVAGFMGCAGVDRPAEKERMRGLLSSFVGPESMVSVGNDAEAALAGALGGTEGYLLIAGTGSMAMGKTRTGESCRAGGWGHRLGDEGSAFWIAFEGIKRGMRAAEGRGEATALTVEATAFFGFGSPMDFIPFAYADFDKAAIAAFAPKVDELRIAGDKVAREIFEEAAIELASLAESVHSRLGARTAGGRIALCGALMDGHGWLRDRVAERIAAACPGLAVTPAIADAQTGACLIARSVLP